MVNRLSTPKKFVTIIKMSKTILVSGGAGFIPSHLCKHLIEEGNHVLCIDNFSTGSKRNIEQFFQNKNFEFTQGDIRDKNLIDKFSHFSINQIYHLASPASVTHIVKHPIEAATVNSIGTYNLLELAMKKNAKLLFASSSETYGDPKEHPQKESYRGNVSPVGVRSGYDEGKRFGEALCMAYYREKGVDIKIVRIFNTYGPNSSPQDSRIVPTFITQALNNQPLTVHGDGKQTRSFCYVGDMVLGFIKMMESDQTGPINLGNPVEYEVIDVAKKIIKATNSKSEIKFTKRPIDDPQVRKPDITLAKEKLNWEPAVSFDEGLISTIEYFKKELGKK